MSIRITPDRERSWNVELLSLAERALRASIKFFLRRESQGLLSLLSISAEKECLGVEPERLEQGPNRSWLPMNPAWMGFVTSGANHLHRRDDRRFLQIWSWRSSRWSGIPEVMCFRG
jgi:hypothetical protein